jgi:hypothetical protein
VWFYLDALLRAKPFLHVSVVQTLEEEGRNLKKPGMPEDTAKSQAVSCAPQA